MRGKIAVSAAAMVALALAGASYLVVGVFKYDPGESTVHLVVELPSSGGLMETSPVTMNGLQIGKVTALDESMSGVVADLAVESSYPIPMDSVVTVANLSAIGEQYLNFAPKTAQGPYFADGARISGSQVVPPLTITRALNGLDDLMGQVRPDDINRLLRSADVAVDGVRPNIARLVHAGSMFATTLRQNRDLVSRLLQFVAGASAASGESQEAAAEAIGRLGATLIPELPALIDDAITIVDSSGGTKIAPYTPLLSKLIGYIELLLGPDTEPILDILQPVLFDPIRSLPIDANKVMDVLLQAFPNGHGMRLLVEIPK
ncbi:MlaD family protein [Antrihabitans sp. YC2-6]|uniref:MlaD family protein n=1 Tax=Antrihabitans sp. YC2-6 TaxID=2799498 RepID=UPI0018F3F075|nr:MlaD family protein [Antrihabitans sp. YC2-6]MBJ8346721.1 MCE family protein [Antrihabitans sp. YC2-6]